MKKAIRFLCLLMCVIIVLTAFTSCTVSMGEIKPASAEMDDSNYLKLPVRNTDSLNPYLAKTEYNIALSSLLFEGLVKVKEDFTVENVIASKVKVGAESVTVKINPSYCFSDSSPITAADVEYSFNLAKESDTFKKQLENFEEISASGDSVTFKLKSPDIYASLCLDFPIVKQQTEDYEGFVTGSGKYKIENNQTLIMNEKWHSKEMPKLRRIRLVNMLDTASGHESVETGNISYYFQDMSSGNYLRKNVRTHATLMTNLVFLGMNSLNENLEKIEVRQAVSLLIPKETIVEESYLGYAEVADTPFIPSWKELKKINFSEKSEAFNEATELLESAGYSRGNDVTQNIMRLRLIVNDDNAFKVSAAENIATALKSAGIVVEVEKLPFETFVLRLQNGEYELYIGEMKMTKNMSLYPFFSLNGGASYGINTNSKIVATYNDFLNGKVTLQRFVDYFEVAAPFAPICFRSGIEMYTNELSVPRYGTVTDRFENIYSWYY
ncbi:MAG: hypothetical protein J6L89_00135 [Clostridia bacterium]|nr:hypothetical protein [Clostridia bacterium]